MRRPEPRSSGPRGNGIDPHRGAGSPRWHTRVTATQSLFAGRLPDASPQQPLLSRRQPGIVGSRLEIRERIVKIRIPLGQVRSDAKSPWSGAGVSTKDSHVGLPNQLNV